MWTLGSGADPVRANRGTLQVPAFTRNSSSRAWIDSVSWRRIETVSGPVGTRQAPHVLRRRSHQEQMDDGIIVGPRARPARGSASPHRTRCAQRARTTTPANTTSTAPPSPRPSTNFTRAGVAVARRSRHSDARDRSENAAARLLDTKTVRWESTAGLWSALGRRREHQFRNAQDPLGVRLDAW
jgi:hypothetical protein